MDIDASLQAATRCDDRGVPLAGRRAELDALRRAGARDLAFGRLYEGHVNAVQLIARCGTPVQRAAAVRDAANGVLFGVWNSQDADGVRFASESLLTLSGAKTWCSGAGRVMRPIVTARRSDGRSQMCVVPMERVNAAIDASAWVPLGMHASDSYRVDFEGVTLEPGDLLGEPGAYEEAPWFLGGAIRFVAVQAGGVERLARETAAYLVALERTADPMQTMRIAEMSVAAQSARNWLDAGAEAWSAFDAEPCPRTAEHAVAITDMARVAVERHALEAIVAAERCVGARGLLEPFPFAGLARDLQMYLRQPAPDAALMRVGAAAWSAAISARIAASADATGTSG